MMVQINWQEIIGAVVVLIGGLGSATAAGKQVAAFQPAMSKTDQLENTIRVLIGLYQEKSWKKVTRGEIEWYIRLAEKQCE